MVVLEQANTEIQCRKVLKSVIHFFYSMQIIPTHDMFLHVYSLFNGNHFTRC